MQLNEKLRKRKISRKTAYCPRCPGERDAAFWLILTISIVLAVLVAGVKN
jgi:hypothetical protein